MTRAFQTEAQAEKPGEGGTADKATQGGEQRVSGLGTGECWIGKGQLLQSDLALSQLQGLNIPLGPLSIPPTLPQGPDAWCSHGSP